MKKQKHKTIFQSLRKQVAPPTIVMKNKKEEMIMNSIDLDNIDTLKYAVDIPNIYSDNWDNVSYFETKEEAINFCKEKYGADEKGRINLITEV